MYRVYKLKDGTRKKIFVDYRDAYCTIYNSNNEVEKQVGFDDRLENPSIVYMGEEIQLENFLYRPLSDTIEIIENALQGLCSTVGMNDFINTLIKERDRVGFIMEAEVESILEPVEVKVDSVGNHLVIGDLAIIHTLVSPVEYIMNHREWDRGIEILPVDKTVQDMLEKVIISTDELHYLVTQGLVGIVDKREYRKNNRYDKVIQRGIQLDVRWG